MTRPEADLLELGTPVVVGGRATRIERRAGTAQRPILRIEGCTTREEIEALRGEPVWVAREDAPGLGEDEFWAQDLVGCAVGDGDREIGRVARVIALPSCEVLEVEPGGLLVPLVGDAVRSVDLESARIDVDLGFLGEA